MLVSQLRFMLQGIPDDAELYCSLGDPISNYNWAAYKASYNPDKNIFYVQYLNRQNSEQSIDENNSK